MSTGAILLTFACVCLGASVILGLLFHFWPRYGSVTAALEQSDQVLAQMDAEPAHH